MTYLPLKFVPAMLVTSLLAGCATPSTQLDTTRGTVSTTGVVVTPSTPTQPVARVPAPPTPSPEETEGAASERSGAIGKVAPDFTLPDASERPTSLSNFADQWVVLYFYPSDDTPGCTCQATEFTELLQQFDAMNAKIVGISPDSPATHAFFMRKYGLNFPLLSDQSRKVMTLYGAWLEMKEGPAAPGRVLRSTYLIDPKGKIAWHWPEVIPQGHAARIRTKLQELSSAAKQ